MWVLGPLLEKFTPGKRNNLSGKFFSLLCTLISVFAGQHVKWSVKKRSVKGTEFNSPLGPLV